MVIITELHQQTITAPKGWISTFQEYLRCVDCSKKGSGSHTQRIERLQGLEIQLGKDPIAYIFELYYNKRKTLREINDELGIYSDNSSLFSLLMDLGWKLYNPNDERILETREPKRQESFDQSMAEKIVRQKSLFQGEFIEILSKSYHVPRKRFVQAEYESLKSKIKRFLYLLEAFEGITKETILFSCSQTSIESTYYHSVLQDKVTQICKENSITLVPKLSKDNLRAWVRNNIT